MVICSKTAHTCGEKDDRLAEMLLFELKSFLGRLFFCRRAPLCGTSPNLLNLGCGMNRHVGWINADFFTNWRFWRRGGRPEWMLDLRYPLKCPDDAWDGIFCEHTLEHLAPQAAVRLLCELRRTLKPGKAVRIIVPDLEKYVRYYVSPQSAPPEFQRLGAGAEAIRRLTQQWGHRSVWDRGQLTGTLKHCGFNAVAVRAYGIGGYPDLLKDSPSRAWESLYIEAVK